MTAEELQVKAKVFASQCQTCLFGGDCCRLLTQEVYPPAMRGMTDAMKDAIKALAYRAFCQAKRLSRITGSRLEGVSVYLQVEYRDLIEFIANGCPAYTVRDSR